MQVEPEIADFVQPLALQRGALRARARAMYTTEGDCRDANFAIASVLAERFRAHQAKKTG